MFNGDGNTYTTDSGNSYTYITNHITVTDSFNTSQSHNGRGGICGIVALVLGLSIPAAILWAVVSVLMEALR